MDARDRPRRGPSLPKLDGNHHSCLDSLGEHPTTERFDQRTTTLSISAGYVIQNGEHRLFHVRTLMTMARQPFVIVVDAIPSTVMVLPWAHGWFREDGTVMKGRFEDENASGAVWLFVEAIPGPPNDFVPHRLRQVVADAGGVQEVAEHHEILWPFVLPPFALLLLLLLTADGHPRGRTRITRWGESQVHVRGEPRLEVFERRMVEHVRLVFVLVDVLALERGLAPDRPEPSGVVELGVVQMGLPGGGMARHQETDGPNPTAVL